MTKKYTYQDQAYWNDIVDSVSINAIKKNKHDSDNSDTWKSYIKKINLDRFNEYANKTNLTEKEKTSIRLLYINKMTHKKAAEIIGCSVSYIGVLRNKSIRKLRRSGFID